MATIVGKMIGYKNKLEGFVVITKGIESARVHVVGDDEAGAEQRAEAIAALFRSTEPAEAA